MTLRKILGYSLAIVSIIIGAILLIDESGFQEFMKAIIATVIIVTIVFLCIYLIVNE